MALPKKLDVDQKYLELLGFSHPIYNGTRYNFTVVTYIVGGQAASAILLSQSIAQKLPNETLLIYNLGLSADDARSLNAYCNNSKCVVIPYDLSPFPSYVTDDRMHAYRPLVIKDALCRSKFILFLESNMRLCRDAKDVVSRLVRGSERSGILGWTNGPQAVSTWTHPKMYEYFETDTESFQFLPMVSLDMVVFMDTKVVNEKILLPWIKCTLTSECIHPIGNSIILNTNRKQHLIGMFFFSGAQSNGCRYKKKPQYRYSGCHSYDASAFNIVLGLYWNFDESKYSTNENATLFYRETLEEATKQLEDRRRRVSDSASDHPFTEGINTNYQHV